MAVGTRKRASGRLMFFEIDPRGIDAESFRLEEALAKIHPHADGSPKRSQYVSIYRVLERVPVTAIGKLFLVTQDGMTLELPSEPGRDEAGDDDGGEYMYVELCPMGPRVVSSLSPGRFARFMTDPKNLVSVPRLFFADCITEHDGGGRLAADLPYHDPQHILDCLQDLRETGKKTKTVDRLPLLRGFYRTVKTGFYVGDSTGYRCFRFPSREALETEHHLWWRSAQIG